MLLLPNNEPIYNLIIENPKNIRYSISHYWDICGSLRSIVFSEGLIEIGEDTFQFFKNLTSITFLSKEPPLFRKGAFNDCKTLTTIIIPADADKTAWLKELKEFELDIIMAFCSVISEDAKIEETNENTEIISVSADNDETEDTYINDRSLSVICYDCYDHFYEVDRAVGDFVCNFGDEEEPSEMMGAMFMGCYKLTSIVLSKGIVNVDDAAFLGCFALKSVVFPRILQEVRKMAFAGCSNLKTLTFEGIEPPKFESDSFYYCYNISEINIPVEANKNVWLEALQKAGINIKKINIIQEKQNSKENRKTAFNEMLKESEKYK